MIEQLLEIFIFTYNRADFLARTLDQFAAGPFRHCSITVLDNHSTDATAAVCERFRPKLPKVHHVRHPKNIGGLANYLRGIELARAEYTWVICDDDNYDFSGAADIIDEITGKRVDFISVGIEGHELPGGYAGPIGAFALNHPYFLSHSFVPSMIFRTSLFDSEIIRRAYDNIETMFPHFPFVASLAERNRSIYVSKNKIIRKSTNVGYSTFRFLTGWAQSCRKISDGALRRKAISEVFGRALVVNLLYCILTERTFRPQRYRAEYMELLRQAWITHLVLGVKIVAFAPLVLMPAALHRLCWSRYAEHRRRQGQPLPNFDENR